MPRRALVAAVLDLIGVGLVVGGAFAIAWQAGLAMVGVALAYLSTKIDL